MQLSMVDAKESIEISDAIFGQAFNEPLVHQVVTAYLAGGRAGTAAQKNRAAVRGGGRKPWKQKGTGRARAGTIRSPIFRGGGVTFAAQPRDYSQKVNKKMYKGAMRSIISELYRQNRLHVVKAFSFEKPKTKELVEKLSALKIDNVLIVVDELDENLYLSARNVANVDVCDIYSLDPVRLIKYKNVLMNAAAIKKIEVGLE